MKHIGRHIWFTIFKHIWQLADARRVVNGLIFENVWNSIGIMARSLITVKFLG